MFSRNWKSKVRLPPWLGLVRNVLQVVDCCLPLVFSNSRKRNERSPRVSLIRRTLIPSMRVPPSWPNYLLKSPSTNTITSQRGLVFQHMNWGEGTHKQSHHSINPEKVVLQIILFFLWIKEKIHCLSLDFLHLATLDHPSKNWLCQDIGKFDSL